MGGSCGTPVHAASCVSPRSSALYVLARPRRPERLRVCQTADPPVTHTHFHLAPTPNVVQWPFCPHAGVSVCWCELRNRRRRVQGVAARVLLGVMIVEEVGAKYDSYDKRVIIWPVRSRAP